MVLNLKCAQNLSLEMLLGCSIFFSPKDSVLLEFLGGQHSDKANILQNSGVS